MSYPGCSAELVAAELRDPGPGNRNLISLLPSCQKDLKIQLEGESLIAAGLVHCLCSVLTLSGNSMKAKELGRKKARNADLRGLGDGLEHMS